MSTAAKLGNLYGDLLDYVISAALLFYILTIVGLFRLRFTRAERGAAVPGVRLSRRAGLVHRRAAMIIVVLVVYRPMTTWPGLVIVFSVCRSIFCGGRRKDVKI